MGKEKPVLMLCKVLKVPRAGEKNITTPKYKLLPLAEVALYPAVSKEHKEL
jgi:hypothetical protein